jgi:D-beta-D-heptose 7-phosphate kinase/D-beta-D-heptose 1-phosphate adenosyltransferase
MIMPEIKTVAVVSGGFDPLHPGHVLMFRDARKFGQIVIAGVNSDDWLTRKKGKPFMSFEDRLYMVQSNQYVDLAMGFVDDDDTAINLLYKVSQTFSDSFITFCNGGDRGDSNTPEYDHFKGDSRFHCSFGVGGDWKLSSSSKLLDDWKNG